jgi:phosphoglycerate kinase
MQAELVALEKALGSPTKPVIAIIGGAKVSTKIDLLENLVSQGRCARDRRRHGQHLPARPGRRDRQVAGREGSCRDRDRIMEKAEAANCAIILPVDATVAYHFAGERALACLRARCDPGRRHDPRRRPAIDRARPRRDRRRRPRWSGTDRSAPSRCSRSTAEPWRPPSIAAERTKAKKLISIAGGGDTVAALNQADVAGQFTYVSTAGGAFLEWMEGKPLPGVEFCAPSNQSAF